MKRTRRIGEMNYQDSDRDSERRSVWQSIVRTLMSAPAIFGNTQKIFAVGIVAMLLVIMSAVCVDAESDWSSMAKYGNQVYYDEGDVQDSSIYPEGVVLKSMFDNGIVGYLFTIPEENIQVTSLNLSYIGKNTAGMGRTDIYVYNWETNTYDYIVTAHNYEPSEGYTWVIAIDNPEKYVNYFGRILVEFNAKYNAQYHLKQVGVDYTYDTLNLIEELTSPYELEYKIEDTARGFNGFPTSEVQTDTSSGMVETLTSVISLPVGSGAAYGEGGVGGSVIIPQDGTYKISIIYKLKGEIGARSLDYNELLHVSGSKFGLGLNITSTNSDFKHREHLYEADVYSKP